MLMVILGAGASYDSASAFPLAGDGGAGPWRPPLANDLFRDPNLAFGHIVRKYPKLAHVLPFLRQPTNGRTVEEELELLQGYGGPERKRELASVAYYLRDLLFEVSEQWRHRTSGVTNYAALIGEILSLGKDEDGPICFVTFNYDLLLDRALTSFGHDPGDLDHEYFAHPRLKLFKPHGSVNWARFIDPGYDARLQPQHVCDRFERIHLTHEFVLVNSVDAANSFPQGRTVFPAVAIPFQNKTNDTFAWPASHRAYFEELLRGVTKILIIGWQAKEEHFLALLKLKLPQLTDLMVVGKDGTDSGRIRDYFIKKVTHTVPAHRTWLGVGGFTHFVINHEGDDFLKT